MVKQNNNKHLIETIFEQILQWISLCAFIYTEKPTEETSQMNIDNTNTTKQQNNGENTKFLKTDSPETIRSKFPRASPFEMEFLMFLAQK